jgi:hypothetical protein
MAPVIEPVRIEGIRELQRALKAMDGESQKALRVVFNSAAELVAEGAQRKVPRRSGRARASIRVGSSQREARVKAGNARKAPYYPWLDFGGAVGKGRSVVRPFAKSGRYIYPSYSERRDEILAKLHDELVAMVRGVGWDRIDTGSVS